MTSTHTPNEYVNIPNYRIFRCDDGRGAGACIYVKDSLNPNPVVLNISRQPGEEDVWVTVQCKKVAVHYHRMYIPAS